MKKTTALVVEDNAANMTYIKFMLEKLGVQTITATSGEKALEIPNINIVDSALLDINLGNGISGITLMEELRKKNALNGIPIIAVTAYYGEGLYKGLLEKGFTDYLGKPFSFIELKTLLDKHGINN